MGHTSPLPVARPTLWGPCRSRLKRPPPQLPADCPEDQPLYSLGLGSAQGTGAGRGLRERRSPEPLSQAPLSLDRQPQRRSKGLLTAIPPRPSAAGRSLHGPHCSPRDIITALPGPCGSGARASRGGDQKHRQGRGWRATGLSLR